MLPMRDGQTRGDSATQPMDSWKADSRKKEAECSNLQRVWVKRGLSENHLKKKSLELEEKKITQFKSSGATQRGHHLG